MEKITKKYAVALAIAFTLITSFGITINAYESKAVLKYYKMDLNKFTMAQTLFDHQYTAVPITSEFYSESRTSIGEGWNYYRFQYTNYYKNNSSII